MHTLASKLYSGYAPVTAPGPFAPWHETHRGGCSLILSNPDALREEIPDWHRLLGCIQRLPWAERAEAIQARRLLFELEPVRFERRPVEWDKQGRPLPNPGTVPGRVLVFDVTQWHALSATLTLRFCFVAADLPGGNLAYL